MRRRIFFVTALMVVTGMCACYMPGRTVTWQVTRDKTVPYRSVHVNISEHSGNRPLSGTITISINYPGPLEDGRVDSVKVDGVLERFVMIDHLFAGRTGFGCTVKDYAFNDPAKELTVEIWGYATQDGIKTAVYEKLRLLRSTEFGMHFIGV